MDALVKALMKVLGRKMNKVLVSGRLTDNPKFFPEKVGKEALTVFNIAVNSLGTDKKVMFIGCQLYGSKAQRASTLFYKGVEVLLEASMMPYCDNYGNSSIKLNVKDYEIMKHTKAHLEQFGKVEEPVKNYKSEKIPWEQEEDEEEFLNIDPNEKMLWDI